MYCLLKTPAFNMTIGVMFVKKEKNKKKKKIVKNSWHILENSNANCKILTKLLKQKKKKKKKFVNIHKIVFENTKQTVALPDQKGKKKKTRVLFEISHKTRKKFYCFQ